jgi:hypothetical protein
VRAPSQKSDYLADPAELVNADVVVRDLYKTQRSRPLVQFVTSMPAVRIPAVVGEGGLEPLLDQAK